MQYDQSSAEAVMATLHVLPQPPLKGVTDKLASVEVGTPEAYYMLAAYCFDLTRKLEYLTKVARPFAEHIPPDLAHEILEDNDALNANGLSWEQRARIAEQIMIRLHREADGETERSLNQAADRVGT